MEISRNKLLITALFFAALIVTSALLASIRATKAEYGGPAEVWNRTFDNGFYDYGSMVRQTAAGGFVVTGGSSPYLRATGTRCSSGRTTTAACYGNGSTAAATSITAMT
jgi:hypothetical protein